MTTFATHLVLGSILGASLLLAPLVHAGAPSRGAPVASSSKSSSEWLRTGEALQRAGRHAEASEAYRQALMALPEPKQRANEGARAAMLAAEARWSAFDVDLDVAHLDAGIAALEHWLALAGPQSRVPLLDDVQRDVAWIRAVRDPLAAAVAALAEHDLDGAMTQGQGAMDALVHQDHREWSIGAGLALWMSRELVPVDADLRALEHARDILVAWQGRRPASDVTDRGPAIDERLAELRGRIQAVEQARRDAELAAQLPEPSELGEPSEPTTPITSPPREPAPRQPSPGRTLPVALLSVGVVATAAGAALLGEGAAFTEVSKARATAAAAEAEALEQRYGATFDRASYDAELEGYLARADRRNTGMLIGGSVLAAGGIAASVVGIVALARSHRPSPGQRRARAGVAPVVFASLQRISLSWRF